MREFALKIELIWLGHEVAACANYHVLSIYVDMLLVSTGG